MGFLTLPIGNLEIPVTSIPIDSEVSRRTWERTIKTINVNCLLPLQL